MTGRANYREVGRSLHLELENQPELVAMPEVGFRTAGWFWTSRHLNGLADARNVDEITRRANGGFAGKESRERFYTLARRVLGVPEL